ncbi:MAG TPA: hypothetical protein VGB43_01715, partial [Flavobacterium sp.]
MLNLIWKSKKPELKIYRDLNGNSIVGAYELGKDFIKVYFNEDGRIIKYNYRTVGRAHVKKMKLLAEEG